LTWPQVEQFGVAARAAPAVCRREKEIRTAPFQESLVAAIEAHLSPGSEASTVVGRFNSLRPVQKQDILDFLRSL